MLTKSFIKNVCSTEFLKPYMLIPKQNSMYKYDNFKVFKFRGNLYAYFLEYYKRKENVERLTNKI